MRKGVREILGAWVVVAILGIGLAVVPYAMGRVDVAPSGAGEATDGMISVPRHTGWQPSAMILGLPENTHAAYAQEDVPIWARGMVSTPLRLSRPAEVETLLQICLVDWARIDGQAASVK